MKRLLCLALFMKTLLFPFWGVSGEEWLLIQPGAGPAGIGNAMVTRTDNSVMSFYNPAGLAFLPKSHVSLSQHTQNVWWSMVESTHNFLSFSHQLNETTVLGGNVIYYYYNNQYCYSGGCQDMSNEFWSITLNYSLMLSSSSSVGFGLKLLRLKPYIISGTGAEQSSKTEWTYFAFDIGYLKKFKALDFGLSIVNIRNHTYLNDPNYGDPSPINFRTGISSVIYDDIGSLRFSFDIQKLLVASYADMDWDGDGYIGRYDGNGVYNQTGDYNSDGQIETAHTEGNWIVGMYTSWIDEWLLGGDRDMWARNMQDGIIGGYDWDDKDGDGVVDLEDEIVSAGFNEGFSFGDSEWGIYNEAGIIEVGKVGSKSRAPLS